MRDHTERSNMSFAFPEDFNTEASSGYYKLEQGSNKFRIMSEPIFGQEYWKSETDDKGNLIPGVNGKPKRKPMRVPLTEVVPASELEVDQWGNPGRVSHFMAMVVYDWKDGFFKVFSSVSKQVNAGIKALAESPEWGDPREYDITITRTGENRETKYNVMPSPKKELNDTILEAFKDKKYNLKALFDGGNPFESEPEKGNKPGKNSKGDEMPF